MARAHDTWTVLPHDPIEELEENLWRVEGALPRMVLRRVMTVARLADGRLVIHNAMALGDAEMARLEAWGEPALLVVPNGWHRLDAAVFKARYPGLRVVCPGRARKAVQQVVAVDGLLGPPDASDASVALFHLEGTRQGEGVMQVHHPDGGVTLTFNDALFNLPHLPGVEGLVMRLMGSTGGPRVTRIGKLFLIKDRIAFSRHLRLLAALPGLRRVIVSHGQVIDDRPRRVLELVADNL